MILIKDVGDLVLVELVSANTIMKFPALLSPSQLH